MTACHVGLISVVLLWTLLLVKRSSTTACAGTEDFVLVSRTKYIGTDILMEGAVSPEACIQPALADPTVFSFDYHALLRKCIKFTIQNADLVESGAQDAYTYHYSRTCSLAASEAPTQSPLNITWSPYTSAQYALYDNDVTTCYETTGNDVTSLKIGVKNVESEHNIKVNVTLNPSGSCSQLRFINLFGGQDNCQMARPCKMIEQSPAVCVYSCACDTCMLSFYVLHGSLTLCDIQLLLDVQ